MPGTEEATTAVIAGTGQLALWPAARAVPDGWTVVSTHATAPGAEEWIASRVGPVELADRLRDVADVAAVHPFRSQVAVALTPAAVHRWSPADDALADWDLVFSDLYDGAVDRTVGWVDSVTGEPLDESAIRDWVQATQRRLATLPRRRVVEIGCGTGMIVEAVLAAGDTEEYVATDLTAPSLRPEVLADHGTRIRTVQAPAHEAVTGQTDVDLTILHSVIQYFPSTDYTAQVLAAAVAATAPGGHVYVGDVRHPDFEKSLAHERAARQRADTSSPQGAAESAAGQDEIAFGPAWFERVGAAIPGVTRVDVVPRWGRVDTEMTRCRYDALLHVGCPAGSEPVPVREVDRLDAAGWSAMLAPGEAVRCLLPNGWHRPDGLTPEELSEATRAHGGHLHLRLSDDGSDACLDAMWTPEPGGPCAWGHSRLHAEWRATPALTPRTQAVAWAELLRSAGVDATDLDPSMTVVLTDSRGCP